MKTGLKLFKNNFLFPVLLLCSTSIPAQIPVNGFCGYTSYSVNSGYHSFIPLNFNNDAYTDLLLFGKNGRKITFVEGNAAGTNEKSREINFKFPLTSVRNLSFGEVYSRSFIYISRHERTAGLMNINDGKFFLLNEYKFNSYPEKTDVADADNDLSPEVLVCGPAFDGISMMRIRGGKIFEKKIVKGSAFRDAVYIDLNNDGYQDIAALNIFTRKTELYINTSRASYNFARYIENSELPAAVYSADLDIDFYKDLILSMDNKIVVYKGDPFGSYEHKIELPSLHKPHQLITGDFNRDGLLDIIYADTLSGNVSVYFAKDADSFYDEHTLIRKKDLKSLIPYYSKFIKGAALLSAEGTVYMVSQIPSLSGDVKITSGVKPGALGYFDHMKKGIPDIYYIDESLRNINFILRDNGGIPKRIFSSSLHIPHTEVSVEQNKNIISFYCWTPGLKLIEIVTADFQNGNIEKSSLYASGKIEGLKLLPGKDEKSSVYISYIIDNAAGAVVFNFSDFRFNRTDYFPLAAAAIDIMPYRNGRINGYLVWQKTGKFRLGFYEPGKAGAKSYIGGLENADVIGSVPADEQLNKGKHFYYIVQGESVSLAAVKEGKMNRVNLPSDFSGIPADKLWISEFEPSATGSIYFYNPQEKTLNLVTLFNKGKNLILSEIISGINVKRYFIKNFNVSDNHIIYTDPEENCISIKRIK